jgi:hypothetical protein
MRFKYNLKVTQMIFNYQVMLAIVDGDLSGAFFNTDGRRAEVSNQNIYYSLCRLEACQAPFGCCSASNCDWDIRT